MNTRTLRQIFKDTDFVHRSGTAEELRVAEYLKAQCESLGAETPEQQIWIYLAA